MLLNQLAANQINIAKANSKKICAVGTVMRLRVVRITKNEVLPFKDGLIFYFLLIILE